jgi:hypothetical protein
MESVKKQILKPNTLSNDEFVEISHLDGLNLPIPTFDEMFEHRIRHDELWSVVITGIITLKREVEEILLQTGRSRLDVKRMVQAWKDEEDPRRTHENPVPSEIMNILKTEVPHWFEYFQKCVMYIGAFEIMKRSTFRNGFSNIIKASIEKPHDRPCFSIYWVLGKWCPRVPPRYKLQNWINQSEYFTMVKGLGRLVKAVSAAEEAFKESTGKHLNIHKRSRCHLKEQKFQIRIVPKEDADVEVPTVTLKMHEGTLLVECGGYIHQILPSGEGIFVKGDQQQQLVLIEFLKRLNDDTDGAYMDHVFKNVCRCVFCGRELTQQKSLTVGAGDICFKRYGGAWRKAMFNPPPSLQEAIQNTSVPTVSLGGKNLPAFLLEVSPVLRMMNEGNDGDDADLLIDFVRQGFSDQDINTLSEFVFRFVRAKSGYTEVKKSKSQEMNAFIWMYMLAKQMIILVHYLDIEVVMKQLTPFLEGFRAKYCWDRWIAPGIPEKPGGLNITSTVYIDSKWLKYRVAFEYGRYDGKIIFPGPRGRYAMTGQVHTLTLRNFLAQLLRYKRYDVKSLREARSMVDDAVSRGDIGDILPLVSDKGYYDSEYSSIHFMDLMNACKEVPDTAEGRKLVRFAFNQDSDNNMALAFSEKCEANPLYDVVEFIKEKIQS